MSKLLGIFILGVLAGWVAEWIFVRLFVPNPKKKVEAALQASRKEIENLQKKNSELQAALTTAAVQSAAVPVVVQEVVPVAVEAAAEPVAEPAEPAEPAAPVAETGAEPAPAVAAVEPLAPAAEPVVASNDDLTKLTGIGPKLAEAMNAAGISAYAQLAEMAVEDVNGHLAASNIRYSKATAESWAAQARLAAAGDWEGLKNYQASLKS